MNRQLILDIAWKRVKLMQKHALIPAGKKTRVGAVVLGIGKQYEAFFNGCNIQISTSHIYHAEVVALLACLADNFKPVEVFVSSRSKDENIHCCLDCRARLIESNPDIKYTIFNPDGTVKAHGKMVDDCKYIMENKSGKIEWSKIR